MMNDDNRFDPRAAFINEVVTQLLKGQGPPDTVRQIVEQIESRVDAQNFGTKLTVYWDGATESAFKAWIISEIKSAFHEVEEQMESTSYVVYTLSSLNPSGITTWMSCNNKEDALFEAWAMTAPDYHHTPKMPTVYVGVTTLKTALTCIAVFHRGQRFSPDKK